MIRNFDKLSRLFFEHFISCHRVRKISEYLHYVKQGMEESLMNFYKRLNEETLKADGLIEKHTVKNGAGKEAGKKEGRA